MRILSTLLLTVGSAACNPVELPGELVGSYDITGQLVENSCGTGAFPAKNPLEFRVQVRREGDELAQWILDEPPGSYGSLDETGGFLFERQTRYSAIPAHEVHASTYEPSDFWSGTAALPPEAHVGCVLLITERVQGNLTYMTTNAVSDSGVPEPTSLAGLNTIELTPAAGSDCRATLIENGGPFPAFPCHVQYDLEGQLID